LSGAVAVLNKLTQTDRDNLYEDKVNPIVQFPGQGIVAFGQKTLQARPSALDRINVRRLLLKVRKYVASTSRYLIFEQNTSTTRNKFINIVNPYLQDIQQKQGLYAFKVVMDESNNTPDSIDRNFLNGSIYLQPTRTAEFIQIDFNILPTGAKFGG
jgi:phage tail sheath protein FI